MGDCAMCRCSHRGVGPPLVCGALPDRRRLAAQTCSAAGVVRACAPWTLDASSLPPLPQVKNGSVTYPRRYKGICDWFCNMMVGIQPGHWGYRSGGGPVPCRLLLWAALHPNGVRAAHCCQASLGPCPSCGPHPHPTPPGAGAGGWLGAGDPRGTAEGARGHGEPAPLLLHNRSSSCRPVCATSWFACSCACPPAGVVLLRPSQLRLH